MIDTPGVIDTSVTQELASYTLYLQGISEKTKETLSELARAFRMAPHGLNAVLLVAQYGARFTSEDSQALKLLLEFLGKESEQYMILILTHGDEARVRAKDEGVPIEELIKNWLTTLPRWVQEFIEQIKDRVILFNNMLRADTAAGAEAQVKQVADLVNTIDAMTQGKKPYVNALTEASKKELSEHIDKAIDETGMQKELQERESQKEESEELLKAVLSQSRRVSKFDRLFETLLNLIENRCTIL